MTLSRRWTGAILGLLGVLSIPGCFGCVVERPPDDYAEASVYDSFMSLDAKERSDYLAKAESSEVSALVREQLQRWLDENRPKLSVEQLKAVEEALGALDPAFYDSLESADGQERYLELASTLERLLSPDQIVEASLYGPHIPSSRND